MRLNDELSSLSSKLYLGTLFFSVHRFHRSTWGIPQSPEVRPLGLASSLQRRLDRSHSTLVPPLQLTSVSDSSATPRLASDLSPLSTDRQSGTFHRLLYKSPLSSSPAPSHHGFQYGSPGSRRHVHYPPRLWLTHKQEELPVLESLIQIRNRLTALKKVSDSPSSRSFVIADGVCRTRQSSSGLKMSCRSTTRWSSRVNGALPLSFWDPS